MVKVLNKYFFKKSVPDKFNKNYKFTKINFINLPFLIFPLINFNIRFINFVI